MQSTGQTSTHAVSFVPIQGSAITYAIVTLLQGYRLLKINKNRHAFAWKVSVYIIKRTAAQAAFSSEKVYHDQWRGLQPAGFSPSAPHCKSKQTRHVVFRRATDSKLR